MVFETVTHDNHSLLRSRETLKSQPVFALTSSKVAPSCSSTSSNTPFFRSTLKTASSVITWLTAPAPVRGRLHCLRIFGLPSFAQCSITTITLVLSGLETRSMAPPIPARGARYGEKQCEADSFRMYTFNQFTGNHKISNIAGLRHLHGLPSR